MRRCLRSVIAFVAACLAVPAFATTYTFTSPNYSFVTPFTAPCTVGTCASYTTSMHFGGSFTTAAPLASNLVNTDVRAQVTSFSFNDGINTYSSSDPNVRLLALELSTDASGVPIPTSTFIDIQQWQGGASPHASGSRFNEIFVDFNADAVNDRGCTTVGTRNGVPDACTASSADSNQSEGSNSVAGTWLVTPGGGPASTTTTLASSANPATVGQSITLTATVSGNAPTGTVQFKDGAANLGSPVALVNGVATLTTSALGVGTHTLTAVYGGDTNNAGSTSVAVAEVVNAATVVITPQVVPTLSEAMLGLLAGLVAAVAALGARRRANRG